MSQDPRHAEGLRSTPRWSSCYAIGAPYAIARSVDEVERILASGGRATGFERRPHQLPRALLI